MKKLFLIVAMIAMIGSVGTVFATAAGTGLNIANKSGNVEITYSTSDRYTITIPEAFSLGEKGSPIEKTVSAGDVFIPNNTKLQVVLTGANCANTGEWFIKDKTDATNTFEYLVSKGEMNEQNLIKNGATILEVESGNTSGGSVKLNFDLKQTVVKAGNYADTLTFTSSIESITQQASE